MVFYPFYIQKQSNDLNFEKSRSTEVKQKYWNIFLVSQHLFVEFINLSSYIFEVFVKFWLVFMRTRDMTLTDLDIDRPRSIEIFGVNSKKKSL